MAYEYISRAYDLDYAPGDRVRHTVTKNEGTVKRERRSHAHYVNVRFDTYRHNSLCHPDQLEKIGGDK